MADRYVYPRRIRKGDKVGVFAPSSPVAAQYGDRFRVGVKALEALLEVKVVVAEQAERLIDGYQAGNARERAGALMDFVRDPEITAIVATIGGYNSADILPHLGTDELRANPKVLVGYSDVTALLVGIQAIASWVTFHGPTIMTDFGEMPHIDPFTARQFMNAVAVGRGSGRWLLDDPREWTDEFLDWGSDRWKSGRTPSGPGHREVWSYGTGSGHLFGGNISTLNYLVGTPYLAAPSEMVFFFEATGPDADLALIQRSLTHLRQAGILDRARAVLIGRSPGCFPSGDRSLRDVVIESIPRGKKIPVIADLPFGHHSPIWTLPLGAEVSVVASESGSTIEICGQLQRMKGRCDEGPHPL
jgi:muramoyltetrapeptide carboxypeptidase LdcA involved in peptidoglycan recycling